MARIRYIKPDLFSDTTLSEVSVMARFLYIGLFCQFDRNGVTDDDAKLLKREVFPYDDMIGVKKVESLLEELVDAGRLVRFEHSGKKYLFCPRFSKHQNFHHGERAKYAIPEETILDLCQPQSNPGPVLTNAGANPTGTGTGTGTGTENGRPRLTPVALFDLWNLSIKLPEARDLTEARKQQARGQIAKYPDEEHWRAVLAKLEASDFVVTKWRPSFDDFLHEGKRIKALEGKYDNRAGPGGSAPDWDAIRKAVGA